MTISKEERAELVKLLTEGIRVSHLTAVAVDALPRLLNTLDAADERIAGLEKEAKHWRESALAWAHWAASVTGEADQEIPDLTRFVATLKARIAELEAAAQWRPIEEAPRDESRVLVGNGRNSPVFARFIDRQWRSDERLGIVRPSHFLPIPALPEGGV